MEEKGIFVGKENSLHVVEDEQFLTITVDISKELGPSASGKTTLIASSGGNTPITLNDGREVKLGLNLYY
jgi:hypothetical protein